MRRGKIAPERVPYMPDTVVKVREELLKMFGESLGMTQYFEDYVTIGSYLSDPSRYRKKLERLENAVTEKLDYRIALANQHRFAYQEVINFRIDLMLKYQEGTLKDAMRKVYFSKLLTAVLEAYELAAGFSLGASGKADIILGNLTGKFNQELRQGRPLKDVGAGEGHGELSHRLQWYLVGNCKRLRYAASIIYRDIANHKTVIKLPDENGSFQYLWIYLFDRDGVDNNAGVIPFKAYEITDFRAPSNINGYLRSINNKDYPLLQLLLSKRYEKRQALNPVKYYAKKLNIPESKLTENNGEEYDKIRDTMNKGGIVIRR